MNRLRGSISGSPHTVMLLGVWSNLFHERNVGVGQLGRTVLLGNGQKGVRNCGVFIGRRQASVSKCPPHGPAQHPAALGDHPTAALRRL